MFARARSYRFCVRGGVQCDDLHRGDVHDSAVRGAIVHDARLFDADNFGHWYSTVLYDAARDHGNYGREVAHDESFSRELGRHLALGYIPMRTFSTLRDLHFFWHRDL